jgi:hypothetical protein
VPSTAYSGGSQSTNIQSLMDWSYLVDTSISNKDDEASVVLLDAVVDHSLNPFVDFLLHCLFSIIIK